MNSFLRPYILLLVCVGLFSSQLPAAESLNLQALPRPYCDLDEVLPPDNHGWFAPENARLLKHIIHCNDTKIIVELGSWLGASTVSMAKWAGRDATVYAVDHFEGSPEHFNDPLISAKLPLLYERFLSNIIYYNLCDRVIPVRMSTLEAAEVVDVPIDLVYVDAAHDYSSVYWDIMTWYPKLKPGGVMCGADWSSKTVRKGVVESARKLGVKHHSDGNFWWFQ